jgi:hypothetical protein
VSHISDSRCFTKENRLPSLFPRLDEWNYCTHLFPNFGPFLRPGALTSRLLVPRPGCLELPLRYHLATPCDVDSGTSPSEGVNLAVLEQEYRTYARTRVKDHARTIHIKKIACRALLCFPRSHFSVFLLQGSQRSQTKIRGARRRLLQGRQISRSANLLFACAANRLPLR